MASNSRSITKQVPLELTFDTLAAIQQHAFSADKKQLSVADVLSLASRQKTSILLVAAVVFALSAAYVFLKKPVYEGLARLQIDPAHSTSFGLDDDRDKGTIDVDDKIKTEVAIIQSDTVAMHVMKDLQLYANPNFAGQDTVSSPMNDLAELSPAQRRKLLERFRQSLTVKTIPATEVVEIRFRNSDPVLATKVTNSIIDKYLQRILAARVEGTEQASQWVSKQMQDVRANTTAAQAKLAQFEKEHNLLGTDESDNIVTDRLKQLNEELTQAEADRIVKEGRFRLANSGNAELISSVAPSTTLQVLRTQEAELQAQYAQISSKFGSGYPKLRELQEQLVHVESEITSEGDNIKTRFTNEYAAASKAEAMIRSDFERQKAEAFKLNENVAQYAILKHEVEAGQQLYDTLQLKLKAAGITSGLASSFVDVIDRAQVPDRPVEPRKKLYLALGLGGGLFGGLLLGFLRDSFDDTIRTPEELEAVTTLPELVSVPFLASLADKNKGLKLPPRIMPKRNAFNPISLREPHSPGVESYRALCSVILLDSMRNASKALLVTSATPCEGKSTVSCNLATGLALRGRKVLLVDADLRCSSIRSQLGPRRGLGAARSVDPDNNPVYQPIANLPRLHVVVPAGIRPSDPTGVLDSSRMQELMNAWRAEYDHIIIDTPPVLAFADALVLAARADAVILVARSGMSTARTLERTREMLARSGANILGCVLNAVRETHHYYDYAKPYYERLAEDEPKETHPQ
jgi:polysaccharide biosynthesis transport protein